MDKKAFKKSLQITSNILLMVTLVLLLISVWQELFYLSIATISLSVVSIVITVLSVEEYNAKNIFKELNNYVFVVSIVISLSVILNNKPLFYVGLVLFLLMIILYFIPLFVKEKEDPVKVNNEKSANNNKNNKNKKKKNKKK